MAQDPKITELQYYAAARDHGWSFGDEDTPKEFCETEHLNAASIRAANVQHWREEYEWWIKKP